MKIQFFLQQLESYKNTYNIQGNQKNLLQGNYSTIHKIEHIVEFYSKTQTFANTQM